MTGILGLFAPYFSDCHILPRTFTWNIHGILVLLDPKGETNGMFRNAANHYQTPQRNVTGDLKLNLQTLIK